MDVMNSKMNLDKPYTKCHVLKELKAEMSLNKTWKHKMNCIQHVNSMLVWLSMCKSRRQMAKSRDRVPLILNLCGRSRWAVSFMAPLLYPQVCPEYEEARWTPEPVCIF